jgi:uncharacterized protein (DUF58 family)
MTLNPIDAVNDTFSGSDERAGFESRIPNPQSLSFSPQTLKRFHLLACRSARLGGSPLLAAARKKVLGGGTEVTGIRDYAPGDSFQAIDWRHCARRDELVVKLYEGTADRTVYVLLDCSASMKLANVNDGQAAKFRLGREMVAALGYVVLQSDDQFKVIGIADGLVADLPALRHAGRLPRLLRFLEGLSPIATSGARQLKLGKSIERFVAIGQRPGPVIVVSDFYDPGGFAGPLDKLRTHGYDPRVVFLFDPRDAEPGRMGDVEIVGAASWEAVRGTITERTARRYAQLVKEHQQSVIDFCRRRSIVCLPVNCTEDEEKVLRSVFFGARGMSHV